MADSIRVERSGPAATVVIDKVMRDPEVRATLATLGTDPVGGSPAAMGKMIQDEFVASKALIQNARLKAD